MKARLFILLAVLACPAIITFLFLGWKASWAGGPASAWMLAAMGLSAACLFGLPSLKRIPSGPSFVMDKLFATLVAMGLLWTLFLCLFGSMDADKRRPGMVTEVANAVAKVSFSPFPGTTYSATFPAAGVFYHLKTGDSTDVLFAKHSRLAVEERDFLILGGANAMLLVFGGLFAGGRFRLKSWERRASLPKATDTVH